MSRIGIIGGGLAGLTVAFRRAAAGDSVTLFEASSRLGGQLFTEHTGGFVIEHGAEGFVAKSKALPALAGDLSIAGDIVGQSTEKSYAFDGEKLIPLAPGEAGAFLGFQVAKDELGLGLRTFRRGMGQLTDELGRAVAGRVAFRKETRVAGVLTGRPGARILTDDGTALEVDIAVVAVPARSAAALLEPLAGKPADALSRAPTLSSVTVSLAYAAQAIDHPLDATGFVVAEPHQRHGFRACTFTSSKFAGRTPKGQLSLRVFFRPESDDLHNLTDSDWTARAHQALGNAIPLRGQPQLAWVCRWPEALPVFDAEHRTNVMALESALVDHRVVLAGSAFHGAGIDAAVRSAEDCASRCAAF